jgi:hypothetical protein
MQNIDELRSKLELADIKKNIERVDYLLGQSAMPNAHALGMKLALIMALELKESVPVGQKSGDLVAQWVQEHPESLVEEAIAFARQFLLAPQDLVQELGARLFAAEGSEDAK